MTKMVEKFLSKALLKDFKSFLIKSFNTINSGYKFHDNWHINLLSDVMNQSFDSDLKRVVINIPPRSLKSVIASVVFPAWVLAKDPKKRIIVVSYSKELALKHSADCRTIMQSDWYKKTFKESHIAYGFNSKHKFGTKSNGYRFATSVGGTLTGEGGDIIIIDDPHNPSEVRSKKARQEVVNWYKNVLLSRLNNKQDGVIILVMQRLHEEDLSGFLLSKNANWNHVCLPLISDSKCDVFFNNKLYFTRDAGDILIYDATQEWIENTKNEIGIEAFLAQYQQKPIKEEGNLIKREWIKIEDHSKTNFEHFYISIDCASGVKINNDYSAIAVFAKFNGQIVLFEMMREKLEYLDLKSLIEEKISKYKPDNILIENKSNGASLIQELKTKNSFITEINPKNSKEYRVNKSISFMQSGNFVLHKNEAWNENFINEITQFPFAAHDDQVDAVSQFLNWYYEKFYQTDETKIQLRKLFDDY
ncbi:MAG: hypothetical protein RL208_396 [Pseudomonadota bacterium]|jgi:predicted phage terminase large subunit-like protein